MTNPSPDTSRLASTVEDDDAALGEFGRFVTRAPRRRHEGASFGDIATSPLYAMQECLAGSHGVAPEPVNVFNAFNPTDYYSVPPTQVVELGARVDL